MLNGTFFRRLVAKARHRYWSAGSVGDPAAAELEQIFEAYPRIGEEERRALRLIGGADGCKLARACGESHQSDVESRVDFENHLSLVRVRLAEQAQRIGLLLKAWVDPPPLPPQPAHVPVLATGQRPVHRLPMLRRVKVSDETNEETVPLEEMLGRQRPRLA